MGSTVLGGAGLVKAGFQTTAKVADYVGKIIPSTTKTTAITVAETSPVVRATLTANLAESEAARASSNFREYAKIEGKVIYRTSSIDDIAQQWKDPGIKANQFELEIKGTRFKADSTMEPNGVPVFEGVTNKQVKDYTFELMKAIGCKEFPNVKTINGYSRYTYKNPETKVSVTLRSESKSAASTGAKWTIDINKHPDFPKGKPVEIKFK